VIGWGARTHRVACRSRSFEAGGSLTLEVRGRVGAASTTPGRAGTARRSGSGKQGGEAYGCRNQWWNPLKTLDRLEPGGCGRGWQRAGAFYNRRRRPRRRDGDVGGHGERLRRSRGQACRGKAGRRSRRPIHRERGNRYCGRLPARQPGGQRQGTPSADGRYRDGVGVVVRGRESRPHGEGRQRVRTRGIGMPGGRW
jgi:hypothetical protein